MFCCIVVTCEYEDILASSEEVQQRQVQVVEQWKQLYQKREMQISQLQNENEQLQDKCEYSIKINYFAFVVCVSKFQV